MQNRWFKFRLGRSTIIIFWLIVAAIFLGIYLFAPSLLNRMKQASYQRTPYVHTPFSEMSLKEERVRFKFIFPHNLGIFII